MSPCSDVTGYYVLNQNIGKISSRPTPSRHLRPRDLYCEGA